MNSDLERLVLRHVNRARYQPVKPRVMAQQLDLPKSQHAELNKTLKKLIKSGKLAYGPNHLVQSVLPGRSGEVVGVFQRKMGGFGFVRPQGTPSGAAREEDIHIPVRHTRDAAGGDTVRVHLKSGGGGRSFRASGEIVEIIQRSTHQFVGTYFEEGGLGVVRVDGGAFEQPVAVGDPGAKNAQRDDKVVIEMVRFPTQYQRGEGVICDVLGPQGMPGLDTEQIMVEFGLPRGFPEEVLEDARGQADAFDEEIGDSRQDLTAQVVITIDPMDARDFDDAISLEQLENGHWRLGVHIADVSHFVRPKSPLDREARERATSIYLPDRVIPMLPEVISNNLASLQPGRLRYTKTVFIEFTPEGVRVGTDYCSAAIRSARRFSYEEVDDFLARPVVWKEKLDANVFALLDRMYNLAMVLRRRRLGRGAIELALPEIKLQLDKHGRVSGATRTAHTASHQIIEEFMLATNEAVAEKLAHLQIHFLRRVHESPDPRKLRALTDFVRHMGITTESLESRFEIQRVLAEMAGRSEEYAVNYAVLRSLPKATYGPQPEGHFALASGCYCHFTSPIRRYPDLTVHRVLDALLRGKRPESDFDRLLELGEHCSQREQRAEQAERELTKLKLLNYLSRRIGQTMEVVVTGVEDFGLFAQGIELPAEGLIHVSSLRDDHYHYDAVSHTLTGHRAGNAFRLGDRLRVEVARVDLDARQLDYRLTGRGTEDRPPLPNRGSKKGVERSTGGRGPRATVARDKRSKTRKSKRRG